ncbi:MAG: right-handed parallel beta-helix repeat-containing protein [Anaerolineales bacterium]
MLKNRLFSILSASTLIVFVLSAILTVPALADSGTTPPTNPPSDGGRTSNKGSSNSLSQVPSGTKVVVLDSSGNKLPLGSQAAQDIVNNGDPIWCPSTVAMPIAGMSGCSPLADNTNLQTLTHAVETNAWTPTNTNSTIWILQGADSSTSYSELNGSVLSALSHFTLTLAGGWTGSGHTVNPATPSVLNGLGSNDVGIYIYNWNSTVTLSNIEVENGTGYGFDVSSSKNIVLTNIQAINNGDYGAALYPGTGATITNSTFNQNDQNLTGYFGLYIQGSGTVTLTDTTTNNNRYYGAVVNTCDWSGSACVDSGNVTLTGTNIFDSNFGDGLNVTANGSITSGSLSANNNTSYDGAYLDNCIWSGSSCDTSTVHPITLTGTSSFSENSEDGLEIHSNGAIAVNNITADFNTGPGALLENNTSSTIPSAITVTGTNWFNDNSNNGLSVQSDGAISLNNINANYNGLSGNDSGLYVVNDGAHTAQGITLTGLNALNYNGNTGADFYSTGAVTVNNVTADCNGYSGGNCTSGPRAGVQGILITNDYLGHLQPQAVTFLGTNELSANNGDNLDVQTYGAVKLNNLTANASKTGIGADLYHGGDLTGAVTLTGTNTFNGNYFYGLWAESNSTITANNLSASDNSISGIYAGAYLVSNGNVTLTGVNTFDFNDGYGLYVSTSGAITASSLTANTNGTTTSDAGVYLVSTKNVSLTGLNTFDFNYGDGLEVSTSGTITASSLTANTNGNSTTDAGVDLVSSGTVNVTGLNTFNFNYGLGLEVTTGSTITASNLTAIGNILTSHSDGVDLISGGNVSLTGTNVFADYSGNGLYIDTGSSITASSLTADFNGYGGTYVNGADLESGASVTLTGINVFNGNRSYGLLIAANGAVMTNNVTADDSVTGGGANIDNENGSHAHNSITMTGVNTFNNNGGGFGGLYLRSDGAITTSNVTANNNQNGSDGAYFDNCDYVSGCKGTGNITMTGTNVFLYNALGFDEGLSLTTNGNVSVTHITADYNDNDGMYVQNTGGTVTITCGSFVGNGWDSFNGYAVNEYIAYGIPSHTYLVGVDASGNTYSLASGIYNATTVARTCTLP